MTNAYVVNWGGKCICQAERVNICMRCEKSLTGEISQAFSKGGYMIDYKYCDEHDN
jgi:hypothetical protein